MPAGMNASRKLAATAAELRALGDRGFTNSARAVLRAEVKPVIPKLKASARDRLPKTGGLNEHVAGQIIQVQTRLAPRTAYIRLRQPFFDAKQLDLGYVRHPVYGKKDMARDEWTWVGQDIPNAAGWFSDVMRAAGPYITAGLMIAIREIQLQIIRAGDL